MKLNDFIAKIDALVSMWHTGGGEIPRAELEIIYDKMREGAAHDLAEAIRQRDEAIQTLHRRYLKGFDK